MKASILKHFMALLALMLAGSGIADAATNYGIYIAETMITSSNASDVLGNGQFSYDSSTKTLTVRNATLTNSGSQGSGISNRDVEGLRIKLVGNSTFDTRMAIIDSSKSFYIEGTGTLTGNAGYTAALYLAGDAITCEINGPVINLTSKAYALRDYKQNCTLYVKGSTTSLTLQPASGQVAIDGLGHLLMGSGISISEPVFGSFDGTLKSIKGYHQDTAYKGKVTIGKAYPLYVGSTQVTPRNASNITGEGISGSVSYNASTNTLYLKYASVSAPLFPSIYNSGISGLTINVTGTNNLTCNEVGGSAEILICSSTSITGSGTLNLNTTGRNYCLRLLDGSSCTIEGPTINGSSPVDALDCYPGNEKLTVTGTSTKLKLTSGQGRVVFNRLPSLTIGSGLYITEPYNGYFSSSLQSVTTDGKTAYQGTVVISSTKPVSYGIYVAETLVTNGNASDVLGNGQFSYDASTKTLTVRNATLTNDGLLGSGISNREVDGLNILLVGTSTFNTRMNAISSQKTFSITGSGTLNGTSSESRALYLCGDDMTCTIDGPRLNLTSHTQGLYDYKGTATLKVQGSSTRLTLTPGSDYAAVSNLKSLLLGEGLYITEPTGGYFSTLIKTITNDGSSAYKDKVVISNTPAVYGLYIGDTRVTSANADDILGNGQFSYSFFERTLTMTNADFTDAESGGSCIRNIDIDYLYIKVVGTNKITTSSYPISSKKSFSFIGTGSLTATSTNNGGMALWSSDGEQTIADDISFTVNGPQVTIIAPKSYAICGNVEDNNTVTVIGSTSRLDMQPKEDLAPFYLMNGITLGSGLYFTEPAGGYFDTTLGDITTNGQTAYKGRVIISSEQPSLPTDYGFYVAETKVTSENADDILGDGQFNYDAKTNTLWMGRSATLTNNDGALGRGIDIYDNYGLTIRIQQGATITARDAAIASRCSFTIYGSGQLTGTSTEGNGIFLYGDTITCTVNADMDITSNLFGLYDAYQTARLRIMGGDVSFQSTSENVTAIVGLGNLELVEPMRIREPEDGWFDPEEKTITVGGPGAYFGKVRFMPYLEYDVWIARQQVTSFNMDDVLGDGTVQCSDISHISFSDAKLDGGIVSYRQGEMLVLYFHGDCEITNTEGTPDAAGTAVTAGIVSNSRQLYITGNRSNDSGRLTINVPGGEGIMLPQGSECIFRMGANVSINAATAIQGYGSVLNFDTGSYPPRLLMNASDAALSGISEINFNDLYITKPADAWFDPQLQTITTDGVTPCAGTVLISSEEPGSDYFSEETANGVEISYHVTEDGTVEVVATQDPEVTEIVIPEKVEDPGTAEEYNVTAIAAEVFQDYESLTTVWIPATIQTIGYSAFRNCRSLSNVYLRCFIAPTLLNQDGQPTDDNDAFAGLSGDASATRALGTDATSQTDPVILHVPIGRSEAYDKAPWNQWFTTIVDDATIKGDVNIDFSVDVADIASIISVMAGSTGILREQADVNGDGNVDVADIASIISIMAGQ